MNLTKYLAKTKPDRTLEEHTKDVLAELETLKTLQYITSEYLYELTKKACQYHDYGKSNREFQYRIRNGEKFNETKEVVHNVLSLYFVKPDEYDSKEDYFKVAGAVLQHHSYGDTSEIIKNNSELIQDLLTEFSEEIVSVEGRRYSKIQEALFHKDTILIKGYLNRCDYSASAGLRVEYPNNFLNEKLDAMMIRWQRDSQKPIAWNPLQTFCKEHGNENMIVTAQTGMGKTEAALLWLGNQKGFFVLPIKTAINAIYDRIRENILEMEQIEERVALLHSDTVSYYMTYVQPESISPTDYQLRSKQLSIPITVTTLDQIFDFVFKYSGYEMKLTTLSYSKLIIDEIQMYDAALLAYLIYGIAMITKYGGKVAILTATLSPFVRDLLIEKGFEGTIVENSFTDNLKRHNIHVYEEQINAEYIIEKYKDNKKRKFGNKLLVVCNTVKTAQRIYQELDEFIPNETADSQAQSVGSQLEGILLKEELHILHNKFIKGERSNLEAEILNFAVTYNEEGEIDIANGIWVATSIVEASLDIDFDYLFTELSDLNGLLQRLGRCNRKGAKLAQEYNCFVFTEIEKNILKHGENGFIDETIYNLSKAALKNVDGMISEEDKLELINTHFTTSLLKDNGCDYLRDFDAAWDMLDKLNPGELKKAEVKLRNIVTYTVIPANIYDKNYNRIEECIEKYNSSDTSFEDKIYWADEIRKYTLNIEPYIISSTNKKAAKIVHQLYIGKKELIYVIDCYYSELGFQMKASDELTIW